jgi:LytS/YehU family sensor histidine kinase
VQVPPLLLQPLVENAVVHGLEPSVRGGRVMLRAHVEGAMLVLEVQDDGLGMHTPARRPGAGLALANIRQRLVGRHGSGATLTLSAASPGTLARITMPIDRPAP